MDMGKDMIDKVQKQQLIRFGHANRMDEMRWPRKVLELVPHEKHKQGWLKQGRKDNIKEALKARDLAEED
jgi:hypothetical protein